MRLREVPGYAARWWWLIATLTLVCAAGMWVLFPHLPLDAANPGYGAQAAIPDAPANLSAANAQAELSPDQLAISPEELTSDASLARAQELAAGLLKAFDPDADDPIKSYRSAREQWLESPDAGASSEGESDLDWFDDLRIETAPPAEGTGPHAFIVLNAPSEVHARAAADALVLAAWQGKLVGVSSSLKQAAQALADRPIPEPEASATAALDAAHNTGRAIAVKAIDRMQAILEADAKDISAQIEDVRVELPRNAAGDLIEDQSLALVDAVQQTILQRQPVEGEWLRAGITLPDALQKLMQVNLENARTCRELARQVEQAASLEVELRSDKANWAVITVEGAGAPVEEFEPRNSYVADAIEEQRVAVNDALFNFQNATSDDQREALADTIADARATLRSQVEAAIAHIETEVKSRAEAGNAMRQQILDPVKGAEFQALADYFDIPLRTWQGMTQAELFLAAADVYARWDAISAAMGALARVWSEAQQGREIVEQQRAAREEARADSQARVGRIEAQAAMLEQRSLEKFYANASYQSVSMPSRSMLTGLAALFGMLISLGTVAGMAVSRSRIASIKDVKAHMSYDVISTLSAGSRDRIDALRDDASSAAVGSLELLRTKLEPTIREFQLRSISVLGTDQSSGSEVLAGNLGVLLAKSGMNVLLVDTDFVRGSLAALFDQRRVRRGFSNETGEGPLQLRDLVSASGVEGLDLLLQKERVQGASALVRSERFLDLLLDAAEEYDMVLCACGNVFEGESAVLAGEADATLVHVGSGEVSFRQAEDARKLLESAEANVLGAVLAD